MPQFKLRIDDDLHSAIKVSSEQNNRSVNSEIAHHLRNAMIAAGYLGSPTPEQTDAPVSSSPPRVYKRLQKATLQTNMPDEVMQELMARIQEVWDKYKSTQDK
ncbi:TA system antitoxin ParD family protein [Aeromonas caviae]